MSQTRPRGEQLRFESSTTGSHILDTYLEAAERGGRTLPDLLADIWATDGNVEADALELRIDGNQIQVRLGTFVDPEANWTNVTNGALFTDKGTHANSTAYSAFDVVRYNGTTYYCHTPHTSTTANPDLTKFGVLANDGVSGSGEVVGPASATDNAIARYDSTTGKIIQDSTATIDDSGNLTVTGTVNTRNISTDGTKLDTIESNATADQTGAEIKSLYEAEANTNAFTDAEQTKLTNIESNATADQTGAEIKTAYEAEANTNAFTDAEQTKLAGIDAGASNHAQVSAAEKTAGTETALRSYSPKDIADMAADHAGASNSDPDVRLLLHFDGSDGDTNIIDSTPYNQTITVQGSSAIDTAQSKFGGSSGEVNSTNTGFVLSGSSNFVIGSSDDFCIECWYRPRAQSGDYPRVWQMGPAGWATGSLALFERQKNYSITKFDVVLNGYNSTNPFLTSTTTVSNGVWYHLAITRESGTVRLFVDGALEDSLANFTQAIGSVATPIGVGNAARASSYIHEFADGWIDDFRLIIGRAEYTAAFTPHTAAHPDPEVRNPQNNYTATTDPGVGDDSLSGYDEGSQWSNNTTDAFFICADPAPGAAVWIEVGASTGMNAFVASLIFG